MEYSDTVSIQFIKKKGHQKGNALYLEQTL